MDAFFAHVQELLSQGYVQVLIGIYVVAQLWWWLKVTIAQRRTHYTAPFKGNYAVVVAAYRPEPDLLRRTLKSVAMYGKPTEIIVAIDDAPSAPKNVKTIAKKYATKVIESPYRQGIREQYAQASEALKKKTDIVITVTAGTAWDESTMQLLAPFNDEQVGAVSGHEVILRPQSFAQKVSQWLTHVHFSVTVPFQSALGAVRPLSSHMIAVRRDIFTTSVIASRSETFLGRRALTGSNESLTAHVLAAGKRTVYQPNATVSIPAPENSAVLRRAQVQQYRAGLRGLLRHPAALRKAHPLATSSLIVSLFSPVLYVSLVVVGLFMVAFTVYQFNTNATPGDITAALLIAIVCYVLLSYVRYIPVLRKANALQLPLVVLYGGLVSVWAKTIALFTFAENARDDKLVSPYGEGKVGRARTAVAAVTLAIFAIAIPATYAVLVQPQNVPFSVITANQGKPFTSARLFAERLNDNNVTNDPSDTELLDFVRANGAHYGQDVSESVAALAYDCVRDVLKNAAPHSRLDNTQACYANAQTVADAKKNTPEIIKENPVVTVRAKQGDTLTWLVRSELKKIDTKHELSAVQAVFIETTYLSQTNQIDRYMDVGEVAEVNTDTLYVLIDQSKQLSPEASAAWNYYAQDIVW